MTLTSHAIVGAAVVSLVPQHPLLGVCAAFMSHFVVDAIPHYDYAILSSSIDPAIGGKFRLDRTLFVDLLRIGGDALLGTGIATIVFSAKIPIWLVLTGAFAGMLPDPLQFVYSIYKHEPLVSLQKFHKWIHAKNNFANQKLLGVFSQVVFIITVILATRAFL